MLSAVLLVLSVVCLVLSAVLLVLSVVCLGMQLQLIGSLSTDNHLAERGKAFTAAGAQSFKVYTCDSQLVATITEVVAVVCQR